MNEKKNTKKLLIAGVALLAAFLLWTVLICTVDVRAVGQNGTSVGFASLNVRFHELTGVHMKVYNITDWLGILPILICVVFGVLGLVQWIKRKSLWNVDIDLLLLGIYYIVVIFGYLIFEVIPLNYRPVLIEGKLEASYPSSTTLLVLSVMPTLIFQAIRRVKNVGVRYTAVGLSAAFALFMVVGRTVAGVHWLTDIIGAILLSTGLFLTYLWFVFWQEDRRNAKSEI